MRSFYEIGSEAGTDKIGHGYHVWYERHFSPMRERLFRFLEIGIWEGRSFKLWEEYFTMARLYGIDSDMNCLRFESPRTQIFIGNQEDPSFLRDALSHIGGELDIVIDDGGHTMAGQRTSFLTLFPHIRSGGYYVIEDLESSYYPSHGGGKVGASGTTLEMLKSFLDDLQQGYHHEPLVSGGKISEIYFYPNIVFIRAD